MFRRFLYVVNGIVLIALLLACLSCFISPRISWPLSFLGLGFSYIVIVVFLLTLMWAIWRRRIFWFNLAALILCWPFIRTVVAFGNGDAIDKGIKVMSYNVKNFDLYNWSGNKKTGRKIMNLIRKESPDIVCFQEFYTDDDEFRNLDYLRDSLGYRNHYFHITYDKPFKNGTDKKTHHLQWGLAIFSRYEIQDTGTVKFTAASGNKCMYADMQVDGKTVRIYNTHLQSIHLGYDDYDTLEELSENQNTNWYRVRNILRKMKRAFAKRANQAASVYEHVAACQTKKIVCGDFNDVPVSYSYQTISSGLQDAFIKKGKGFSKSFSSKIGFFRIDFILPDPSMKVNSYYSIEKELSDHYPIISRVEI